MKKILTFLILFVVILGASVNAQEVDPYEPHCYAFASLTNGVNAMASDRFTYPWTCHLLIGNAGITYRHPITETIQVRFDGSLNFGIYNVSHTGVCPYTAMIFGIGANFIAHPNVYWHLTVNPRIDIHGTGVQTNGDVCDTWFVVSTGPGFQYDLEHGHLFCEVGITRGFDIIAERGNHHNDVYFYSVVGYRYQIDNNR